MGDTVVQHETILSFQRRNILLDVPFVVRPPLAASSLNIKRLLVSAQNDILIARSDIFLLLFKQQHKHI